MTLDIAILLPVTAAADIALLYAIVYVTESSSRPSWADPSLSVALSLSFAVVVVSAVKILNGGF